jgi:hypothetical protein
MAKTRTYSVDRANEPGLDFNHLPMEEIIQVLRRLGLKLLEDLLEERSRRKPGKPLPVMPQPILQDFLSKPEIQKLSEAEIWQLKRAPKTGRIPGNLREELPKALKKMAPKAVKGKVSFRNWQLGSNNRLALALGGTRGNIIPDALWPLTASSAWNDPGFQFTAAQKIIQHLRNHNLMIPYQFPDIELSDKTFWFMILLGKKRPLNYRYFFSRKERNGARIIHRLQELAQREITVSEWAGFWDQWIILQASQRWPEGFRALDPRISKALVALPLLDTTQMNKLCKDKKKIKIRIRPIIDNFFEIRDRIKRQPMPAKSRREYALLNMAAPRWQEQMPTFFSVSHGPSGGK